MGKGKGKSKSLLVARWYALESLVETVIVLYIVFSVYLKLSVIECVRTFTSLPALMSRMHTYTASFIDISQSEGTLTRALRVDVK